VAIVENGTHENERAVATTLQDLTDCVVQLGVAGPAVIFVGLDWADAGLQRPATVTVYRRQTRPEQQPLHQQEPICAEVFL
jgi:uroporphyrin-III C-methyltransferase/precorrin-2 dehydrogenase/sirohydrochlorin ferrochelatase